MTPTKPAVPLVSIVIPAYNAERWIAQSLSSAMAQTWPRKEIIVVDDGSTDRTAEIARKLATREVQVVSTENRGMSAAVNLGLRLSRGDYIQELDSDDLISPDKIERQIGALRPSDSRRVLLSSPWGYFYHRPWRARFVRNSLWQDLSPTEWLLRKLGENLHMQNATWLVSRELAEAAGPWNESLNYDQDGEYFTRVLAVSDGVRFVPEGRVYYRTGGLGRISFIGTSERKKESLLVSMAAHVRCLRGLEDSPRVRVACLSYLQNWYWHFVPDRPDLAAELQRMAGELGGALQPATLRPKYAWLVPLVGRRAATWAQTYLPQTRQTVASSWDLAMYRLSASRHQGT